MSVYKDPKTGKWVAAYYVKTPSGETKKTKKRGLPTKAAAQAWELSHKGKTAFNDFSFAEMFELMSQAGNANETTTTTRRNRLNKYAPELMAKKIRTIKKADLVSWRSQIRKTDLSTQTVNDTIGYVKQVFKYAYDVYEIPDPSGILKKFKKTIDDEAETMHIVTPDQFRDLIAADDDPRCVDAFTLLYLTGMRKGELRALQKSDYTERNGQKVLHIHQSMRRGVKSTKTTKTTATRFVPLDDTCIEICERLSKRKGKYLIGDYKPIVLTVLQDHFKADLAAAGLPDEVRIHDLRHSHVSLLWANNVPIPEISKRIGHSSPAVTMRIYAHIFDNKQSQSLKILNSLKL